MRAVLLEQPLHACGQANDRDPPRQRKTYPGRPVAGLGINAAYADVCVCGWGGGGGGGGGGASRGCRITPSANPIYVEMLFN
jgi:hypothetical protein